MPNKISVVKDQMRAARGADTSLRKPPATTSLASSEEPRVSGKSNLIEFRARVESAGPQGPDSAPHRNPSARPCQFVLDSHVDEILLLARRGRDYRNIARTFGVSALDIWRIVTDELSARRRAA